MSKRNQFMIFLHYAYNNLLDHKKSHCFGSHKVPVEFFKGPIQARNYRAEGGRGGGSLPCPFSKIGKKCPNFGQKCPDCGHLWVKFLI